MKKKPEVRSQNPEGPPAPGPATEPVPASSPTATPASAQSSGRSGEGDSLRPFTRVADLPDDLRELVRKMLIEGATVEDVVEAVNECGREKITLHAVHNYFRSDLALQQARIKWQRDTAKAFKEALGDPESGQQEVVDAVLMTGLMRLTRRSSEFGAKDALHERFDRQTVRLKQEVIRQREQKLRMEKRLAMAHWKSEEAKTDLLRGRLAELNRLIEAGKGEGKLGPETLQKIQEIYGIVKVPYTPAKPAEYAPEPVTT
ncbi:MAG: phage protein Gp27 family protein [Terriglobia bacterium]